MLKPSDVEQKTFSTALRGYDLDEVDDFLDEIVATIRELNEQLEAARAESQAPTTPTTTPEPATETAAPPTPPPAAPAAQPIDESAIGRALVAAQTAADQLLEDARTQAEKIVGEARTEADDLAAERETRRREAQAEIDAIASRVTSIKSELATLAGEVAVKVEEMDDVIAHADLRSDAPGEETDDEDGTSRGGLVALHGGGSDDSSDDLGDILDGVANDLQLNGGTDDTPDQDEDSNGEDYEDDDEGSEDEDE